MGRELAVTLEWGPGFQGQEAISARNSVRESVGITYDAMTTLGVPSTGKRTIYVQDIDPMSNVVGRAAAPDQVWLYSSASQTEQLGQSTVLYDASTLLHEDFHIERMKWHEYTGILEKAIAEALCFYAEHKFTLSDARFSSIPGPVPAVLRRKSRTIEQFGEVFLDVVAAKRSEPIRDEKWLLRKDRSVLSRAEQVAVRLVDGQFNAGAEFSDLIPLAGDCFLEALGETIAPRPQVDDAAR